MANDFRGYNLTYSIKNNHTNNYTLQQALRLSNLTRLPNPLDLQDQRIDFDILVDSNQAWREEASSLVKRSDGLYVQYAHINKFMHIEFFSEKKVDLDIGEECYGLVTIAMGIVLLDCQKTSAVDTVVDFHLIVPEAEDADILRTEFPQLDAYKTGSKESYNSRKENKAI